jgi:membrane-bound lytic murein transglycosylase D
MLGLSQLYYPIFEEKLDQYNLPLELKHLAVIESALNPTATSRVGARGLWQFMYATGKMYNLEITSYVDERCDPYKSTEAACQFLQYLYSVYGDWQICLAAYNAGPGNINKAIRRAGGGKKTYWEIRPFLPKETQAYVPAFIAATYIMTYHQEHNLFAIAPRATFYDVDSVSIKQEINFAQIEAVLGIPNDQLTFLNPMYKLGVVPVGLTEPYHLILPNGEVGNFVMNEEKIYNAIKTDSALTAMTVQQIQKTHTVKKGEHINSIAKKYKVSPDEIRKWNNLSSNTLRTGQKLTIWQPVPVESPTASAGNTGSAATNTQTTAVKDPPKPETNTGSAASSTGTYKYYVVKKGDSLWSIAQANGTTVDELKRLNGYGSKVVLHVGDKIKIKKL